jgi:hypothetical protein
MNKFTNIVEVGFKSTMETIFKSVFQGEYLVSKSDVLPIHEKLVVSSNDSEITITSSSKLLQSLDTRESIFWGPGHFAADGEEWKLEFYFKNTSKWTMRMNKLGIIYLTYRTFARILCTRTTRLVG